MNLIARPPVERNRLCAGVPATACDSGGTHKLDRRVVAVGGCGRSVARLGTGTLPIWSPADEGQCSPRRHPSLSQALWCSPLTRAVQTALVALQVMALDGP